MPNYRRNFVLGGTYFFTAVTAKRRPLFADARARLALRHAILRVQRRFPFETVAIVLLPDHLHTVWRLPTGDANYSIRWARIKAEVTQELLHGADPAIRVLRRPMRSEREVWQSRFWEHTCRDEDDVKRCVDYVHWNPVKHGMVKRVTDYPWSSFHRFVRLGEYVPEWGSVDPCPGYETPELF